MGQQSFTKRVVLPLFVIVVTIGGLGVVGLKLMGLHSSPASASPTTSATSTASPTSDPTQSVAPTSDLTVVVLNGTQTPGLARTTADAISHDGWVIQTVGNWTGVAATASTVYYPDGFKDQAQKLADQQKAGIAPLESGMNSTSLTFVVVK